MNYIKISDKMIPVTVQTRPEDITWNGRETKALTFTGRYQDAIEMFIDGVQWSLVTDTIGETGDIVQTETDMSHFALAGSVTDNRDGTVTVKMGKHLKEELLAIPLGAMPRTVSEAKTLRTAIETAAQSLDDFVAVTVKALYPMWTVNTTYAQGHKVLWDGILWKCIQAHTSVPGWEPENTASLWEQIDETHAGTLEDPVPYNGNMVLTNGVYYCQNDIVYRCIRDTGNPVHQALADLVGLYVETV